mmetsp:Transcript_31189/g.47759  ORF Transcript_31189/g.47759 Transcript_31189/m.47759 type:complete len:99 (-) Transcript_31189:1026-1322(-)
MPTEKSLLPSQKLVDEVPGTLVTNPDEVEVKKQKISKLLSSFKMSVQNQPVADYTYDANPNQVPNNNFDAMSSGNVSRKKIKVKLVSRSSSKLSNVDS